jgi:hypothetical protein
MVLKKSFTFISASCFSMDRLRFFAGSAVSRYHFGKVDFFAWLWLMGKS